MKRRLLWATGAWLLMFMLGIFAPQDMGGVKAETGETVSDGDEGTDTAPLEITKIGWEEDGYYNVIFEFNGWKGEDVRYRTTIEIYKDGEFFTQYSITSRKISNSDSFAIADYIDESGSYKVRVKIAEYEDGTVTSDWSDFSEEKEYVRPDKALGSVTPSWDPDNKGWILFDLVEGAEEYVIRVYKVVEDGLEFIDGDYVYADYFEDEANRRGEQAAYSMRKNVYLAGEYRATVRARSSDINTIAHGVEGEPSAIYNSTKTTEEVRDYLQTAMEQSTATDIKFYMFGSEEYGEDFIELSELSAAMKESPAVVSLVKELEDGYIEENGIEAIAITATEEVKEKLDVTGISTIGATYNIHHLSSGNFAISLPETEIEMDGTAYAKYVQLDMRLIQDGKEKTSLTVPVAITMPVPKDIDKASNMVLFNYSPEDGGLKQIAYKDNGDGTVTFVVTQFGTFVFAEKAMTSDVTVSDIITEAMESESAEEALQIIKENVDIAELKEAMQTDTEILPKIKNLEEKYKEQEGIITTVVAEKVKDLLDTAKISMVGAALNGETGSKMSLTIVKPEKEVTVDKGKYAYSVQLDIKLLDDGVSISELKVPMAITLPIPKGIDAEKEIVIYHFPEDSEEYSEKIPVKVDKENNTLTFVTGSFSTFAVVNEFTINEVKPDDSNPGDDNQGSNVNDNNSNNNSDATTDNSNDDDRDDDDGDDNDDESSKTSEESKTTEIRSPKTGDQSKAGFAMTLLVSAALISVLLRKKGTVN